MRAQTSSTLEFVFSETMVRSTDKKQLAVAFHSLVFLDGDDHVIGERLFDAAAANMTLGNGWHTVEQDPDAGSIRWGGAAGLTADLQLDVPAEAKSLLLNVLGIKDSLIMDVLLDGAPKATLRVDAYWHSGYVPLGGITEYALAAEPVLTAGRYFPTFATTDKIYVLRMHTELDFSPVRDQYSGAWERYWKINDSFETMMGLTLVGMQGVINRASNTKIYLDWREYGETNQFWVPFLESQAEVISLDLDGLSAVNFLMERFGSHFGGFVIYDLAVPATINLATMYAGLDDKLILAPDQIGMPGMPDMPDPAVITDLRDLTVSEGWDSTEAGRYAMYQWVHDNLWPGLEHRLIGIISTGPPTSMPFNNGVNAFPLVLAGRDYLIALRAPALFLSAINQPQATLLEQFLAEADSPIPVTGVFWSEEREVTALVSRYGNWDAALHWPGQPLAGGNVTVFSGIRPAIEPYQPRMDQDKILATLGDNPIATLFSSDGDNLHYQMNRGFHTWFVWEDVQDQQIGWTTSPILYELAPLIWNYYTQSISNSSLIVGLSGAGYIYPTIMSAAQLTIYLDRTATYMSETGLRTVRVDERMGPFSGSLPGQYYAALKNSNYLGVIAGYGGGLGLLDPMDYVGAPSPTVRPSYSLLSDNAKDIVNSIMAQTPGEILIDLAANNINGGELVPDPDAVGDETVMIPTSFWGSPGCCLAVVAAAPKLYAGDYEVTISLKVADNQSSTELAHFYVGDRFQNPIWTPLASRYLAPADFSQPGQYQQFILSFTLSSASDEVEIRLDYLDDATVLYADYIHLIHAPPHDLPAFNVIFIGLIVDPDHMPGMTTAAGSFVTEFESRGGIILTPDEYLAALNPEYMLGLAQQRLGAADPDVIASEALLVAGEYMNSLLMLRAVLRQSLTIDSNRLQPANYGLLASYPNPFNPSTILSYGLSARAHVILTIYDIMGREVAQLVDRSMSAGYHQVAWNGLADGGQEVSSGIYIARLFVPPTAGVTPVYAKSTKMVLLK